MTAGYVLNSSSAVPIGLSSAAKACWSLTHVRNRRHGSVTRPRWRRWTRTRTSGRTPTTAPARRSTPCSAGRSPKLLADDLRAKPGHVASSRRSETGADEPACRPDPVRPSPPERRRPVRPSISGAPLPAPSCGLPADSGGQPSIVRAGRSPPELHGARPSWPCSGWGLPSRPGRPGRWWSLTPPFHPYPHRAAPKDRAAAGGLISVALSRRSPWVGVAHHLALWSPDLPRRVRDPPRPPGRLVRPLRLPAGDRAGPSPSGVSPGRARTSAAPSRRRATTGRR